MGVVWHVLIPLVQIAVYFVVFSQFRGLHGRAGAHSFALYLCAGMLPWFAFQETVNKGSGSLVSNERYLKKLAIPEAVFVGQTAVTAALTLIVYIVALLVLVILGGLPPAAAWLLIPVVLVLHLGIAFGFALILAPLCVFFRDIGQLLGIILQVWFWLTPILYDKSVVGPGLQTVIRWNPPATCIDAVRALLLRATVPAVGDWAWMFGLAIGLPTVGLVFLQHFHSDIRDAL
jgi:lipopolysaccharide transport system permease protein